MTSTKPARLSYPSTSRAVITLIMLFIVYIFSYIDRQILSLLVGPIRADLGVTDFQMGLLQGFAFSLFFCLCGIPLGRLADYANRKWLIAVGLLFWSVMTMLSGFADSFLLLFLFRIGVGVGEAALSPAVYSILADSFPPEKLVRATSVMAQGPMVGAGLSLLMGGAIIAHLDTNATLMSGLDGFAPWQQAFILAGAPGLLLTVIVLMLREPVRQNRPRGTVILPFGATVRALWADRATYGPLYLCGMLMSVVTFSAMTWFPTHLMRNFGMSAGETGAILGVIHLAGGAAGAVGGATLTEFFLRRGRPAGYMYTVLVVALLMIVSLVAPFMSTVSATLVIWVFAVTLQCSYSGSIYAAMNIATPNQMRAFNIAMMVLGANMFGLAVGSAAIGGLATPLFGEDPAAIGKSLSVVGVTAASIAAIIAWRSLPHLTAVFRDIAARNAVAAVDPQNESAVMGDAAATRPA